MRKPGGQKGVRKVRTAGGSRYYGLPIGSPITADDIARAKARNGGADAPAPERASAQEKKRVLEAPKPKEPNALQRLNRKVQTGRSKPSNAETEAARANELTQIGKAGGSVSVGQYVYTVPANVSLHPSPTGGPHVYAVSPDESVRILTPNGIVDLDDDMADKVMDQIYPNSAPGGDDEPTDAPQAFTPPGDDYYQKMHEAEQNKKPIPAGDSAKQKKESEDFAKHYADNDEKIKADAKAATERVTAQDAAEEKKPFPGSPKRPGTSRKRSQPTGDLDTDMFTRWDEEAAIDSVSDIAVGDVVRYLDDGHVSHLKRLDADTFAQDDFAWGGGQTLDASAVRDEIRAGNISTPRHGEGEPTFAKVEGKKVTDLMERAQGGDQDAMRTLEDMGELRYDMKSNAMVPSGDYYQKMHEAEQNKKPIPAGDPAKAQKEADDFASLYPKTPEPKKNPRYADLVGSKVGATLTGTDKDGNEKSYTFVHGGWEDENGKKIPSYTVGDALSSGELKDATLTEAPAPEPAPEPAALTVQTKNPTYADLVAAPVGSTLTGTQGGNEKTYTFVHGGWEDENGKKTPSYSMNNLLGSGEFQATLNTAPTEAAKPSRSQGAKRYTRALGQTRVAPDKGPADPSKPIGNGNWDATSMGRSTPPPNEEEKEAMLASPYTSQHLDANGNFTPERLAVHDAIIESFLEGLEAQQNPIQYMNGGGPASGKGTMTKGKNAELTQYPSARGVNDVTGEIEPMGETPPGALLIDPDAIKMQLPEVKEARARQAENAGTDDDKQWAGSSHEESSQLAKRMHRAALERGYNVIYDGTGNGSANSVRSKVRAARALGYRVEANYLFLEPQEGIGRAKLRADRANRIVPASQITGTYAKLPAIFDELKEDGTFDKVNLFDNNVPYGEPAKHIGSGDGTNFEILDPEAYQKYMSSRERTDSSRFKSAAEGVIGQYSAMEPEITSFMEDMAAEFDVELSGLNHRLKKPDSLSIKMSNIAAKAGLTPEEAAPHVRDALRYTMKVPDETYVETVERVLEEFRRHNYEIDAKNSWAPGSEYMGINVTVTDPETDKSFEVQFHTPESLRVKHDLNHPIYKSTDVPKGSKEWKALQKEMIANSAQIPVPEGVYDLTF